MIVNEGEDRKMVTVANTRQEVKRLMIEKKEFVTPSIMSKFNQTMILGWMKEYKYKRERLKRGYQIYNPK